MDSATESAEATEVTTFSSTAWERELLALARQTIEHYLETGTIAPLATRSPELQQMAAVFVTLRRRTAESEEPILRGCVGQVEAVHTLGRSVQLAAIQAATCDPRFEPLRSDELESVSIEISILSAMTEVRMLDSIEIGRHGLYIVGGGRRGLLLPSVPVQFGWDQSAFLSGICMKAGLPDGVWPGAAQLYAFTTRCIHA